MFASKYIITLSLLVSAASYSTNSSADDGLTPGPGLFSGESGEFNLNKLVDGKTKTKTNSKVRQGDTPTLEGTTASGVTKDAVGTEADNFSAYKEWRKLNESNPEVYDNFDVWLEYQTYLKRQ